MSKHTTPRGGLEPLLSIAELSEYIGVPMKTIKDWRVKGEGPAAIKMGNHVRYDVRDVKAWIQACHEVSAGVPATARGRG